ncbi:MAG: hypothetical protein ABIP94_24700 [Planctomycetota bacterium]
MSVAARERPQHGAIRCGASVAFGLWAPLEKSVELHLLTPRDRRVAMARTDGGWHTVVVEGIEPGAHARARELGRSVLVTAESSLNDTRLLQPAHEGGFEMDGQWDDDFHHAMHARTTGERARYYIDFGQPEQVAKGYRQGWIFDGQRSAYDDELMFALAFAEGGVLAGFERWQVLLDTEDPRWRGESSDGRQGHRVVGQMIEGALRLTPQSAIALIRREPTS